MIELDLKRDDFINQYPPLNLMNAKDKNDLWKLPPYNIYIHIPFCIKKCDFCYYKSYEIPFNKEGIPSEYFDALLKEMDIYNAEGKLNRRKYKTIYVGGGTPTLMSSKQLNDLFMSIEKNFSKEDQTEICFEIRPGIETSEEKLKILKSHGVSRISIGCQSLNDEILRINGRNHNTKWFYKTYELVKKVGFPTVNVDIMSGLVGETLDSYYETVRKLISIAPENITIYKMELYLNSKLYKLVANHTYSVMEDKEELEYTRRIYHFLIDNGYELNDNFSFRLNKKNEHIHRTATWFGEDMIGMGISSHSRKGYFLYQNTSDIKKYIEMVKGNELPINRAYHFTVFEDMVREIVFAIKKLEYDLDQFYKRYGIPAYILFKEQFDLLQKRGYIEIKDNIMSTTLEGALFADDIVKIFYPKGQENITLGHLKRGRENA